MAIGSVLQTSQKTEQAGPPFVPTSARNGVSVDAGGFIVLGNDAGGALAVLLNNREIPLAGFRIDFTDPVNSTIVRINNAPLNPFFLQANVNAQWSNIIAQNASAGNQATSFLGSYNNLGNNISLVKTSSTYTGNFGYPFNTGIVYSASVGGLGTDAMAFVTEAGFYWAPNTTGAGGVSQVAMRMLANGNLQLYPIGTGSIADIGTRMGVFGRGSFSSYPNGEVRTSFVPSVLTVAMNTELSGICIQDAHNTANAPIVAFYKSRGTSPNTPVTTNNNDQLGRLLFQGVDSGGTIRTAFEMRPYQSAAAGATFVPGGMLWFVTNAAGVNQLKFWYTSEGQIGISGGVAAIPAAGIQLDVQSGYVNTPGTAGNTYRWAAGVAAPALNAGPVFANYYGGNGNALGDPAGWALIRIGAADFKIPYYNV